MKFDWKILLERLLTAGIGMGAASFVNAYRVDHDLQRALSEALYGVLSGLILGTAYDQAKFRESKREEIQAASLRAACCTADARPPE